MKLTTRGHYSVKALLDLALQSSRQPISVAAIAERQTLPPPYLEKLLIDLRRAGIVESVRGSQGGYRLAKRPDQISLGQILEAVGEQISPLSRHTPRPTKLRIGLPLRCGIGCPKSFRRRCTAYP